MSKADAMLLSAYKEVRAKVSTEQMGKVGSHLEGRLLTIVEASVVDKTQQDAMKSLVRQAIWDDLLEVNKWIVAQDAEKGVGGSTFPF